MCVGSLMIWLSPNCDVICSILLPSKLVRSFAHQFVDFALKSPIATKRKGLFCAKLSKVLSGFFPSFFLDGHCPRGWSKINLKVHDVISCLNKNLIAHFLIFREGKKIWHSNFVNWESIKKKKSHGNLMQKMYLNLVPDPYSILVNNSKQLLHTGNTFKNKILCKMIIKKPLKS